MSIKDKIMTIVSNIIGCPISELTDKSGLLTQFNWDSLNHISIITDVEQYFHISIQDDLIVELNNIKKLTEYVEEKIK